MLPGQCYGDPENGWSPMTAALQLFTHLDGEALNVALLMSVKERERLKDLVNGLSEYYNSPGRLAVVRRRFESASRWPGVDPATFATELGILAVRGFEDMGERGIGIKCRFSWDCVVTCGGQYWIGWPAGYGSSAVVPATSAASSNGTVVGGRPINVAITPAETGPEVDGFLMTSVVLPPGSEIVAPFSVSGVRPNCCALFEPSRTLMEEYGVIVGHTLVDASTRSASVLMVNPNAEKVVLPSFTCVGKLVSVSAISVALADPGLPNEEHATLPEHLEEIVMGSHPSLGDSGRQLLRDLLYRYRHVFPAPREPVTGRKTSVQHEILTSDARPVRCGPRRLAPAGLRMEQTCVQEMILGGQIEPSDSPWASPVVFVTKKDGSTRFCVDYRRLNALTTKDAYPLPQIDDSLLLLGNQQWFSTMDLASGY